MPFNDVKLTPLICMALIVLGAIRVAGAGTAEVRQDTVFPAETAAGKTPRVDLGQVTVTGRIVDESAANVPAVVESITAEGIERINALETSDVFKYMPGSYLRKLYPGSTNSPLVIRGNNSTMTGRTLVMMDGIRISDFTAAGHGNAPKWFMVSPQEIEKVDVIYGPFSAAMSGNSMSGTALITTRMPRTLEIRADAKYFFQNFHSFETDTDLDGYNAFASVGNKTGRLSYHIWCNRLETENQPISFIVKAASGGGAPAGNPVTGWVADQDPKNRDRYVLGAAGVSEIVNNTVKVKLGYDLTDRSRLRYTAAFWDSQRDEDAPETYLRDSGGNPVYSGTVDIGSKSFRLSDSTFRYRKTDQQDLLNALSYEMDTSGGIRVSASASAYTKLKHLSRQSSSPPTDAGSPGAGRVTDADLGWYTADLKAGRAMEWAGLHSLAFGYHFDQYSSDSETWNASDWFNDVRTTLKEASKGKTCTHALFVEDTWDIDDQWSVYLGGRYEWWKGFDAAKSTDASAGRISTGLPDKDEADFSPKFSTTFMPGKDWRLRLSFARAVRYPTVGELYYGGITSTGIISKSNPDLKAEQSFAKDFTITRYIGTRGEARLTFFEDDIENAIFRQTNAYTQVRNFQNVDEVRTRGIELALNIRKVLIDGLGLFTNLAWTDSQILRNENVPESVGKDFPRVPEWRAKCVLDYAPTDKWALTLAGHYSGRQYGQLDNSDTNGGYGGVDDFLVFDAKFTYHFPAGLKASVGVNNITDELYHVHHPYPMRAFFAELKYAF